MTSTRKVVPSSTVGSLLDHPKFDASGLNAQAAFMPPNDQQAVLLRALVNATEHAMLVLDHHYRITFANTAAVTLGLATANKVGDDFLAFFSAQQSIAVSEWLQNNDDNASHRALDVNPNSFALEESGQHRVVELKLRALNEVMPPNAGFLVITATDVTEQRATAEQMRYQALYDGLTGLPNRTLFNDHLNLALSQAKRHKLKPSVLFIDLDGFKKINDSFGHTAGDQLLRAVALRLNNCIRESDSLCRYGGDEFLLLLPDTEKQDDASRVANKLINEIQQPFSIEGRQVKIGASVGIAMYPEAGNTASTLLHNADSAMYNIKHKSKGGFSHFCDAADTLTSPNTGLTPSLGALLVSELRLQRVPIYYQSIANIDGCSTWGVEAFPRWKHQNLAHLHPNQLADIARTEGVLPELDLMVLRMACHTLPRFRQESGHALKLNICMSPETLCSFGFAATIEHILAEGGLSYNALSINIELDKLEAANLELQNSLKILRSKGVTITLDNFTCSYKNNELLKSLPIDAIKLERNAIHSIQPSDTNPPFLLADCFATAHALGIFVFAKGVQTKHQLGIIELWGCVATQGYLFGKPQCVNDTLLQLNKTANQTSALGNQPGSEQTANQINATGSALV